MDHDDEDGLVRRVDYRGFIVPDIVLPFLYVASPAADTSPYLIAMAKRLGLPLIQKDGDHLGDVQPAQGEAWRLWIGPSREITLHAPDVAGPRQIAWDRPMLPGLIYGGIMSSREWCDMAIRMQACIVVVGPPFPDGPLEDALETAWCAGGAIGWIPVTSGLPPAS
jgi:hypothetical protein